ncbi:gliding motility-associated C-terminal domain-containing protein [Chitinophaga solisilvae]|uniref:Ig-like domain-containing protein n=1 Tax=Chitinophaga solisilvae TaxID=1233460 RepID=UPI001367CAE6|nr:gliding motility-associated C-terminal domain-containing protein [Chitinophaga solisilvae]
MHSNATPKRSLLVFSCSFVLIMLIAAISNFVSAYTKNIPMAFPVRETFIRNYQKWHPHSPLVTYKPGARTIAAGPLWSYAGGQSKVTFGGACFLCDIQNPTFAIDGDLNTASKLVLPVGVLGGIAQKLQFPGSYQAGDQVVLDLEIPDKFYTKQLMSAVQIETFNAGVANNDIVKLDNQLVRVQLLGVGPGSTNKFRVTIPITKAFDEVQIGLSAIFAEFGALLIYEAAAVIPISVNTPATIPVGGNVTLNASLPRVSGATFKWYNTAIGGTPLSSSASFTTPVLTRSTTYYVEAITSGLQSYIRTPVHVKVSGGAGALWSFGADELSPVTSGVACALCFVDNPDLAVDGDTLTASKIVLPAGVLTSAGQRIYFSGSYKAGDNVSLDLEIPNKIYTKQALSGIKIETFNNDISNGDATTIGASLIRLQALGVGPGGISKFRVVLPVTKDFNAVQVSLAAAFAEFGALKIYEAAAFVPVKATPDTVAISRGQTTTLTAAINPRMANATFRWFTTPTGGTQVGSGSSFTTPALSATTTYYVEATTPGDGLTSFVRTPVYVRVRNAAGAIWSYAAEEQSPVTGGVACALCFVDNPTLAIDGDTTTASKIVLPVGLVTTAGQLLKFPATYKAGDYVVLDLQIPDKLYTKQLLSAIKIHTKNNGVDNNDAITLDNSLIRLQALGLGLGSTPKFRVMFPVTKDFDAVQVDLSALFAEFGALQIYEAAAVIPVTVTPPAVTPVGSTVTLTASMPRVPNATYKWYSTPTGGTPLATGATFTTPALTRTTDYYVEASVAGAPLGAQSYVRTPVHVKVSGGAGPLWSFGAEEVSPVTGGIACALCYVDNPGYAIDGDTLTASKIVLPVGVITSVGQRIIFSGSYKAGDNIALDLEIPDKVYTKQALSGIQIETFNNNASNGDITTIGTSLIRLQVLGVGPGGINKFRVILPVTKDFNAVQVSLAATFAEFGALKIYEATAFVPVKATPDSIAVSKGQTATLNAAINPRMANATFRWYNAPTGGSLVGTGSSFVTPPMNATTTYYVEATTPADGLTSFVRTPVYVRVRNAAGALWSYAAEEQSPVTSGVACALCFVDNPTLAIDGDTTTASRIVLPVGLVTTAGQLLKFPASYKAGDYVVLDLQIPDKLYTKQLLSAIKIHTKNNGVDNNDAITLDNSLIRLQALGIGLGSTPKFRVMFPATKDFDAVQVDLSALFAEFGALLIYEAAAVIPVTVNTPAVTPVGSTVTLTASMPRVPNVTFRWFNSPTGGTQLGTGATFTTPVLTRTTDYYVEATVPGATLGGQSYVRTPVRVKVSGGAGPLWTFGSEEVSPVTGGVACALCFVDNPGLAIDGDTTTASRIVLPVGIVTSVGQRIIFSGSYKAGDNVALDLEIPDKVYTKQALSGIQIESFNNNVSNGDVTTIGTSLIRLQALGVGPGGISKFRVVLPVTKDFNAIQVSLAAAFAEFGALKIYEATAFVPVKVTPDTLRITKGQSTTLTASINPRIANPVFRWYTTPTGGTPVGTGATFTTPALNDTTTYYAEAFTAVDGLSSFVRTPVYIKVRRAAGSLWSFADDELSPVTSGVGCALCFVNDPKLAVDEDTTTASTIVLPVGVATSAGQRLRFPGGYKAGDYVSLDLEIPGKLFSAQALSGIQVETFNNEISNADNRSLSPALVRVQLLGLGTGGTNKFRVIFPVLKDFDAVQVSLSSLFSAFGSLKIYDAAGIIPIKITPDSSSVVRGGSVTFAGDISRVPGASIQWFSTPAGGTPLSSGPNFTTPPVNRSTVFYAEATGPDGLKSFVRTPAPVTVTNGVGPLWTHADQEQSPVTGGLACALCFVDSANLAVDGDTTTASKLVLPVGVAGSIGQVLKFPGNYKAGDFIALDLQIPGAIYTKQLLSAITMHTLKGGVDNNDPVTLNNSLIRLQALGLGIGSTPKFRVILKATKDFDAVQVDLAALFAEFGSLRIYEATAFIPVTVTPSPATAPSGGTVTLTPAIDLTRVTNPTFKWYTAPTGGTPVFTGTNFTTPPLSRNITYYVEAFSPVDGLNSYVRTPVDIKVGGGPGTIWSFGQDQTGPFTSGLACLACTIENPELASDGDSTTASKFITGIGVGTTLSQRVIFPGVYQPGDSIVLIMDLPGDPIANAQLIPNIKVRTFNNAISGSPVDNNDEVLLNNTGLVRLQVLGVGLSGANKFRVTIPATKTFDAVQVGQGSLVGASSVLRLYEVTAAIPITVTPSPATAQYNKTATLNAAIRVPNATFQWFSAPTGGVPLPGGTGATFTTPNLSRNTIYYVEATDPAGKKSFTRTAVPVKVKGGAGPLWSFGTDQQSPITGGIACVLCTVTDSMKAIDGDTTTASKLVVPAAIGGSVGQKIIFPGSYLAGDSIILFLSVPGNDPLASVQLLGSISVKTSNGGVENNDPTTLSNNAVGLSLLGLGTNGERKFRVAIPAKNPFDAAQVDLGSLVGVSNSLSIYEVAASIPVTLVVTPTDTTIVSGQTATFNASIPRIPDATFNWYTTPTGGAPIATTNTFVTPPLTQATTYYVEATSPADGLISLVRTAVTVKVTNAAGPGTVGCGGGTGPSTDGAEGLCLLCNVANPGLATDGSPDTYSTINVGVGVAGKYYQQIPFAQAGAATDSIRIKIGSGGALLGLANGIVVTTYNGATPNPSPITVDSSLLMLLNGSTTGTITLPARQPFTSVRIAFGSTVGLISALNVYYVKVITPVAKVAASNVFVCSGQPATLTANGPAGYSFRWFTTASGGTPVATTPSYTTPAVTGTTNYFVEAVGANGCGSEFRTPVTVTTGLPSVTVTPASANVAQGSTPTFNVVNPDVNNIYNWYTVPTGGTPVFAGTTFGVPPVNANITYYVEAVSKTNGTCKSLRTPVPVTLNGGGGPGTPVPGDIDCGGATTQLSSANGLCIGCFVEKQDSAVDNNTTTSSSMHVVAGLLGGYTEQVLIFPTGGKSGDSVRIGLSTNVGLADVGVLPSIQISSAKGATSNNDAITLDNPLINLRLLSGSKGVISFKPGGNTGADFDRVVIRLNSGVAALLTSLNVYYAQIFAGPPTVEKDTVYVCSGATASLKATGPGTNFRWYTQLTGGSPVGTGATLSVPNVTANAVYYVEAISGAGCANPARKAVYVMVGLPKVIVAPESVSVNSGATATFTVTNPNPQYDYNWYDAPSGGTQVASKVTSFTTPPLTAAKIYYVEAVDKATGCASSQRTKVTADINLSPEPVPCSFATQQQSPIINGVCLLCAVDNPALAVDNNANSASTINATVGAVGYIGQLLTFQNAYAAGDSITMDLEVPGQVIGASLLGGIRVETYNGATANSDARFLDAALIRVELLSTGNKFRVTFPVTKAFTGVLISINGAAVSLLTSVKVYFAAAFPPRPTPELTTYSTCAGKPDTLKVTGPAGADIAWFDAAVGGTQLGTGNIFITPALTSSVTYYVQSGKYNCANPVRVPVLVTVGAGPAAPTAPGVTLCAGGKATLVATAPPGVIFHWYKSGTDTAILATGTSFVTPTVTADTAYYVAADNNGCLSTRTRVPVTVTAAAANFTVTPTTTTVSRGQGALINASSTGSGIIFKWYNAAGDSVFTGPAFNTGPLQVTTTYTVTAVNAGGCASAPITVTVNVLGGGTNDVPCDAATTETNSANGICIGCYVDNPALSVDGSTTTGGTLHVVAGLLGGYVQQTVIFPTASNPGDSVNVHLAFPVALADVGLLSSFDVATYNGATYNNDRVSIGNSLLTLRLLSGNQQAVLSFKPNAVFDRVELRLNSGLASLLNAVSVNYANRFVAAPEVTADSVIACAGDSATLSIKNPVAGVTYKWYSQASGGVALGTGTSFRAAALTNGATYYAEATKSNIDCPNPRRKAVKVVIAPAPPAPGQPATVNVCLGSNAQLAVDAPNRNYTYGWYNAPTGGTKLNTDSGFVFNVINVRKDTILYVEAVNSCGVASPRQAIAVKVSSSLSAPIVTPNPDSVNLGVQAVLTASNSGTNLVYTWYGSQNGNDSLFTGPTYSPPTQNTPGTVVYWVEASLGGGATCKSIRVPATVVYGNFGNPRPVPCEGATSQTIGGSGLLVLGNVYNPQLAVDNDATTASSLVINVGALNAQVWERAKFNGVSVAGDTVRVLLSNPSVVLSAQLLGGIQLTTYNGTTPGDSLMANNPLIKLTLLSNNSQALLEFVPTKQFDAVEVKLKSGIVAALTEVGFNYAQRALVQPVVQANQVAVCAGNTATLNVQNPAAGITYRWYTSNGTYLAGKDGPSFTTGALSKDTTFFVEAFRNGCASKGKSMASVKVAAAPAAPAVLSADVKVCTGANADLAIATPAKGYTYNWYNVATGGTKLNTDSGFVFRVMNVTAPATYYVEAVNDSCKTISATRTAVKVSTAAALDVPKVTPATDTVVVNQQAIFTASAATANTVFYWFRTQTSTDTLFKGAVYAAPASATPGTVTFWVEAALPGATVCKSARVPATAITIPDRNDPVPCEGATGQTIGGSGLLVLGNVYNPQLAVDNSANTAASLVINLGALNASVWEKATFSGGVSAPGDTVKVLLSNPSVILSAAVLASVQLTSYNGSTRGDSILVSNPLLHLELLSGNRGALLSFVPTKPFDGVEVKLKSGILGALTEIGFNYAQRALVQPTVQVSSASVCKGGRATLKVVNPAPGVTYSWFDNRGNRLLDSIAYVTPATLDSGTYVYFARATRNGCQGAASAPAQVRVLGAPGVPVPTNGNNATTCLNTPVTLSVNPVAGVTFNWYDAATGGAKLASNTNTYTTPANLAAGTYNFYIEAVNGNNCTNDSARAKITLRVDSAATAADINAADQVICAGGTAVLTPTTTTVQNPVFKWYANPDKTGPITTGVSATGVLTIPGLAVGTYTYYVSVSNAGKCENAAGALKAVKVTVNKASAATDIIAADTTVCAQTTVTLKASSTTVTNPVFKWYADAALKTLLQTGATYTTGTITATTTFYVTVEGSNSCANTAGNAKAVTVSVTSLPAPVIDASSISICAGDSATLTVKNALPSLTYRWYSTATGGTPLFTGPVYVVKGLTASADFYAEVSAGSCAGAARTKVSIGVGTAPVPILESNNVTVCQGGTAILKVTSSTTGITYKWYTAATGGTLLFTGPIFTTPVVNTTTQFYVEAVGTGQCGKPSARATATVNAVPVPAAPVIVTPNVSTCIGQNISLAIQNPQAGVTYQWFTAATGGTLVFTGPVYNVIANSNVTYYVQALVGGGCPSATRSVATITVNTVPATPEITASSLSVCAGGTVTLGIKNPVAGTIYRWYNAATGGTLLATGTSFTTGALTANTDFYVEASNGNCAGTVRAKVSIGVGQAPTPILEANNVTVCQGGKATLRVISAANNVTYRWYTTATGGTAIFTGPTFTTDPLTNSMDFYVEATGNSGQCGNPSARVKAVVTVTTAPAAPEVTATTLRACAGTGVTVSVKNQQAGITYQWYNAATGGTLLFTGPVYNVPVVNSNTTFYVQANVGTGCSSATRTGVTVTVDPSPATPTVSSDNVRTCIGGTATFAVQNPDPAVTYRWYSAPSNGTLLATGTSYTTGPLALTTTFYLEAINSAGCSSVRKGLTATVVSTIDPPLADPATTCAGQTIVLSVKGRQAGVIYNWYTTATGGTPVFTGADFTITPNTGITYYLGAATSGGCTSASRTPVIVTVNPAPAVPAVANATIATCLNQRATLNVLNPDATLTYRWYTTPTGGTPVATGATYTTPPVTANQMYYLEAVNSNSCPSATRTAVSVTATGSPVAPTVTGNETGICPGKTATLTATSTTAGANFRWYSAATGGNPLFTGATFTTNALTANTTYYVEVFTTGGCVSTVRTAAEVTILQPLATPNVVVDNTTATSITFRWNPVPDAQRYEVSLDNGVTFIPPSSGNTGTTHTVSGLQPNQTATIRVRAIGNADCQASTLSNGVTGTTTNPQGNNIYVPNLFSPNGDGVNDIEYVYSTAIAQLEFRIYNQWGQLVFTSKDQRQGWDGTMSGVKQPVGVYVYIVKATMRDGTVVMKKGNVTLMR